MTDIIFPDIITKHNHYLSMNEYFLYARNKNLPVTNKGNHSAFVFVKENLYAYFEEKIIT